MLYEFVAIEVDLTNANLAGADLARANLTRSDHNARHLDDQRKGTSRR
jgi:uncharacterized protein YjbI with pentapeptide repeats